jgi:hypothetical protein
MARKQISTSARSYVCSKEMKVHLFDSCGVAQKLKALPYKYLKPLVSLFE